MKEALKFTMNLNERLVSKVEGCVQNLEQKEMMVNT